MKETKKQPKQGKQKKVQERVQKDTKTEVQIPESLKNLAPLGKHLERVRAAQDAAKSGLIVIKGPLYPPHKKPKNLKNQKGS